MTKAAAVKEAKAAVAKDPVFINTECGAVAVFGHDLVSKKDLTVLGQMLSLPEFSLEEGGHGVFSVVFRGDGLPVNKEGSMILGACAHETNSIVINLMEVFSYAFDLIDKDENTSIWTYYQRTLYTTLLHEIHHLNFLQGVKIITDDIRKEGEELAEKWCIDTLFYLAKNYDIEPTHFSKSPFFCKQNHELIHGSEDEFIKNQRHMLDNNIFYSLPPSKGVHDGLNLHHFKAYLHLISGDKDNDPEWSKPTVRKSNNEPIESLHDLLFVKDTPALTPVEHNPLKDMGTAPVEAAPVQAPSMVQYAEESMDDDFYSGYYGDEGIEGVITGGYDVESYNEPAPYNAPAPVQAPPVYNAQATQQAVPAFNAYPVAGQTAAPVTAPVQAAPVAPASTIYPNYGHSPDYMKEVVRGIYKKINNHIFSRCERLLNSPVGFAKPEMVHVEPIALSDAEKQIIIRTECMDANGRICSNMPVTNGELRGFVMRNAKLPAYKLHFNFNGNSVCRLLLPQNPAKDSKYGIMAQQGHCILHIMEGDDKIAAISGKFKDKIVDNVFESDGR
jgi:hypothetical protein